MPLGFSIIAAFGAMLCWGVGDFLIQRSTRKVGDIEALALIGIIGTILLLPFAVQDIPLLFSVENIALLSFLGIVTFFVAIIEFEALKKGKLSVIEVVMEIELPVTALLGFMFFRETLSPVQSAVILLIFIGIFLISLKSFSKNPLKGLEKGVLLAVIGAIGMALMNFLTAAGARLISPLMAIWVPWVVFTAVSLFFIWRKEGLRNFCSNAMKFKLVVFGMGLFDTMAWLFFATALLRNELAITTAITESYPAIGIFLGTFINKEKIFIRQYAGAVLALASSFCLAFVI